MSKTSWGAACAVAFGMAAVVGLQAAGPSGQASSGRATSSSFKIIGCVERTNGSEMAGAAGSGTSTASSATSGSNAADYILTKLDPASVQQAAADLGKEKAVTGSASASRSPVADPSMQVSKAKEFVLRPANGQIGLNHYLNQQVEVTGELVDAATAMAGPTSAGATGTAGSTGMNTSNLNTPGITVTEVRQIASACNK